MDRDQAIISRIFITKVVGRRKIRHTRHAYDTGATWSTCPACWTGMTAGGPSPRAGAGSGARMETR